MVPECRSDVPPATKAVTASLVPKLARAQAVARIGAACASLALGWVVGGVLGLVYAWRLAR